VSAGPVAAFPHLEIRHRLTCCGWCFAHSRASQHEGRHGGGGWESNPPGTVSDPTLVLKTRGANQAASHLQIQAVIVPVREANVLSRDRHIVDGLVVTEGLRFGKWHHGRRAVWFPAASPALGAGGNVSSLTARSQARDHAKRFGVRQSSAAFDRRYTWPIPAAGFYRSKRREQRSEGG